MQYYMKDLFETYSTGIKDKLNSFFFKIRKNKLFKKIKEYYSILKLNKFPIFSWITILTILMYLYDYFIKYHLIRSLSFVLLLITIYSLFNYSYNFQRKYYNFAFGRNKEFEKDIKKIFIMTILSVLNILINVKYRNWFSLVSFISTFIIIIYIFFKVDPLMIFGKIKKYKVKIEKNFK